MNSPPTPPYCDSVAAALHLMNAQIRCGSCREKVFSGFCLSFVQILNNSCSKKFSPLMPINFLINCLINFWTFRAFRVPKQIKGFLMNQFMNINVSKKGPFTSLSFLLLVSLTLYLSPIREIRVSKQHTRNTASWEVGKGERRRQSESWWQRKVGGKCFWVGIHLLLFIFMCVSESLFTRTDEPLNVGEYFWAL